MGLGFDYVRPLSVEALLAGLSQSGPEGVILAGGTDLHVKIRAGKAKPRVLFDVSELEPVRRIVLEDNTLRIGGAVRMTEMAMSADVRRVAPSLVQAVMQMSSPQIRNRGTLAGNIVTASPAADAVPPLVAADAAVALVSPAGRRELPLSEFIQGPGQTGLRAAEVLTEVIIPVAAENRRSQFIKVGRRKAQAISIINLAGCIELTDDGRVRDVRVVLGAVAPTPLRARRAEQVLRGSRPRLEHLREAAALAGQACMPITDIRATATGRRRLAEAWTLRLLQDLTQATGGRGAEA